MELPVKLKSLPLEMPPDKLEQLPFAEPPAKADKLASFSVREASVRRSSAMPGRNARMFPVWEES